VALIVFEFLESIEHFCLDLFELFIEFLDKPGSFFNIFRQPVYGGFR
jgi:hypothetical protein